MHKYWWVIFPALLAAVLAACGDGGAASDPASQEEGTSGVEDGGTLGSVAPDVFMEFDGQRYRAVDVLTIGISLDDVEQVGQTETIDVDHEGAVAVYRLTADDSGALYTFQTGQNGATEEESVPDTWLRWELEP